MGEKTVKEEDCFILKLEAEPSALRARSSSNVEITRHTVRGYFSQRTGLLVQLEDSQLLRIKTSGSDSIFWETTMESLMQDYRSIDGISIAHGGRTSVTLFRFGENSEGHSRTRMEEIWAIEEVDFNIKGLSMDCFLPPADLKKDQDEGCGIVRSSSSSSPAKLPLKILSASSRISASRVAAIELDDPHNMSSGSDDEEL